MVGILLFCWPLITASNTASQSIKEELLKNLTYRNIGPTRQGGRFVDFAVPKQKPYTFYAATASGGLWKTVNYYLKNNVKGEVEATIYKGDKFINVVKGKGNAGINKVVWDMTQRRERTEEGKKEARERMERFRAFGFRRPIDINYAHDPVPLGEYKIVLKVGDREFRKNASVLQDHWYDKYKEKLEQDFDLHFSLL